MSDYEKWINHGPLTIVDSGPSHFCLEYRLVEIHGQTVQLTNKEFDLFALLVLNPRRVFTYEMIKDIVWKEDYTYYSRKAIHNHISNLKKKFKHFSLEYDFVVSVHGVGYKGENSGMPPCSKRRYLHSCFSECLFAVSPGWFAASFASPGFLCQKQPAMINASVRV